MRNQDRTDRLLMVTTIAVGLMSLAGAIAQALLFRGQTMPLYGAIAANILLVPALLLARAGYRRLGAWIVVGVVALLPLAVTLANPSDPISPGFEAIALLIAAIFLPPWEIAVLAVVEAAAIALLPLIEPGSFAPTEISGFAFFTLISGGVILVAARHRAAIEADRAMLERQLIFRDRMASVGILTAGITHEIRNSLTSVILSLDALTRTLEAKEQDPEAGGLVRGAQEAARRIKEIVGDLQAFGRADVATPTRVRLSPVVESAIRISRHALLQRARISTDVPPDAEAFGSEGRLAQVLLNLLINAAQAIPEGHPADHEIRVSARTADGHTILEVRDTGTGIAPEIQERIFDPFFTTKGDGEGTGLGLWIIRNLVTDMGGEVRVDRAPERGTVFQVVLRAPTA